MTVSTASLSRAGGMVAVVAISAMLGVWLWPSKPPLPARQPLPVFEQYFLALHGDCKVAGSRTAPDKGSVVQLQKVCAKRRQEAWASYSERMKSRRAEIATFDALTLTFEQARISALQAVLTVLALGATAWAAWAAADASRAAKSSVAAAEADAVRQDGRFIEQLGVAAASASAAQASADATVRALELTAAGLRAYVTPTAGRLIATGHSAPLEAYVEFENGGQTPARSLSVWVQVSYRPFPDFGTLEERPNLPASRHDVGPGAPTSITLPMGRALTSNEMSALNAGTAAIFVWGAVEYQDFLGRAHETRFRLFLGGDYGVRAGFPLCPHQDGNSTD